MHDDRAADKIKKRSFWEKIISQKLHAPVIIVFLLLSSLFMSLIIAREGFVPGVAILCGIIGLPIAYGTVAKPEFGIALFIIASFFINFVSRFMPENTPIGVVMDALTYLLILGFFVRQKKEQDWSRFNNPISYFILVWIAYNIIEVLNPVSPTILEWVYTVRTVGFIMLMYFIFVYHIRSKEYIRFLLKLWLFLEIIAVISAFQQEHIGLLPFESSWLHEYPERFQLLFIEGHLRKWAIFSDPVVFAFNMVISAILCIALMLGKIKFYKKIILLVMAVAYCSVMLYSGTRASYVIIPAAMVMLAILNFNKKVFAFMVAGCFILGVLVIMPTSNRTLARFQSAFRPSHDASFEVRAKNQERIRPYILSHPIGGGLGSVGVWGQRFAPNSYLAKFPPDSGYVRVAVEMGWIGLFIYCLFNFIILYQGIGYYFQIKDPELKSYCLAMILIIFALDIGNYPQQSIVQYPTNILFFLAAALLNVTMRIDIEQRKKTVSAGII